MMFRNSYRMLLANFGTFWKDFLYKAAMIIAVFLLTMPILNVFSQLDVFEEVKQTAQGFFSTFSFSNVQQFTSQAYQLFNLFLQFVSQLFQSFFWQGVYLLFLYFVLLPFLFTLSELAISEVLYGNMATNTKYNYSASFIKTLPKALLLALFKGIALSITTVLILTSVYGVLHLGIIGFLPAILVPFAIIFVFVTIAGFFLTVLCGWAPSIIVFDTGVFTGFRKGFKAVSRRFFKTYSNSAMIWLIFALLAGLLGVVSLILLVPLSFLMVVIFGMIMFFGSQGMRYYVDPDTILSPKKLEETDKFEDSKNII